MDAEPLVDTATPAPKLPTGRGGGERRSIARRWAPALVHPAFRVYWVGALFSGGGIRMFQLTAAWLAYDLATPPLNVALVLGVLGFCRTIPLLLFSLIGGVAADRFGRRRILLVTSSVQVAVAGTFALIALAGLLSIWLLLLAALLAGTAHAFHQPAHQAFIRDLVTASDTQSAVALMAVMQTVLRIGAPLLAGGLLARGGGGPTLVLIAACYAVMAVLVTTLRVPSTPSRSGRLRSSLAEGFGYIRSDRLVLALLLVSIIPGLFALPSLTVLPIFADGIYGRGVAGLGLMESMIGLGALLGALLLASLAGVRRRGLMLLGAIGSFGGALILFALIEMWPVALVLLVVVGLSDALYIFTIHGLLLARAPEHLRGRVMSVSMLTDVGMSPPGSMLMGTVAAAVGAQAALAAFGTATIALVGGVAARVPRLRRA